jgi:hypothetical protein
MKILTVIKMICNNKIILIKRPNYKKERGGIQERLRGAENGNS